jgi:Zinc finger, C2H2 type
MAPFFDNIYKCLNGCGRSYKLLSSLTRHLTFECGVAKKFVCTICDRAYTRNESLKYHMHEKHKHVIQIDTP